MKRDFDIEKQIEEIGRLVSSAIAISSIRREVASVMRGGFVVTDGRHHEGGDGYDVVVNCGAGNRATVHRRIGENIPDVRISKIAEGILGIKIARRYGKGR